ncbi:MAG: 1,4-dihydroxy-2-naphthoate octaprenyltransferase [Bdellovibrionales bacterium]|nr:1,4-dihydroxy-2-naphthoate octaprenyltransferase [Bdellovibrionales bacterium]
MNSWILAVRPKTLSAAVVPIVVASALASRVHFEVWIFFFALMSTLFIQIATNLFNDVIDFNKGADTSERLGPLRVTQSGLINKQKVFLGAVLCLFAAAAFGLPLIFKGGIPIIIIGVLSLVLGYAYTGGPFPLAYEGLGDFFVLLFFGLVAVGGVYYLHTGEFHPDALVAGLQIGMLSTVLIAINNFRDWEQDIKVNKKTLSVRWGPVFSRWEVTVLFVGTYFLGGWWLWKGFWLAAVLPLLTFPVAWKVMLGIHRQLPGKIFNRYLALSSLVLIGFGLALSLGLLF